MMALCICFPYFPILRNFKLYDEISGHGSRANAIIDKMNTLKVLDERSEFPCEFLEAPDFLKIKTNL